MGKMLEARLVRELTGTGFRGHACLYRCEPAEVVGGDRLHVGLPEYVVVSAVVTYQGHGEEGPETYIFRADADGHVTDWMELRGSAKGTLDHATVLASVDYAVVLPN